MREYTERFSCHKCPRLKSENLSQYVDPVKLMELEPYFESARSGLLKTVAVSALSKKKNKRKRRLVVSVWNFGLRASCARDPGPNVCI